MLNTLIPLLFAPLMHSTQPPVMPMHEPQHIYMHEHMPMMEDETNEPIMRADVSGMERRMMQRTLREIPGQVRRKGYQDSSYWYRAARMEGATRSMKPGMPGTDLTQRTHRGLTEWSRRTDRRMRDYPRGCTFPCGERN